MRVLSLINRLAALVFLICYAYQFVYIPVPWIRKLIERIKGTGRTAVSAAKEKQNDYAVLICARNEEAVIGGLIDSLHAQTYEQSRIHIFVMADNCSDRTAKIASDKGAAVYLRWNLERVGKGYALDELMKRIREDHPEGFDGYFVFDADNILAPDYIGEMDRTFSEGYEIVTGYRNSKNYGDNWISAGYALWFLRESRYLNHSRFLLRTSAAVSGTGFMFGRRIAEEMDGWPYHLLTEDIEFTADQVLRGRKIAFCENAELFDEQPVLFSQSFRQRLRWSKGFLQVFRKYGGGLTKGLFRGSFSCFDLSMTILPAFVLSVLSLLLNIGLAVSGAVSGDDIMIAVRSLGSLFFNMYLTLFGIGLITVVTEWKRIHTGTFRKILYLFTFPVFMFTYVPISVAALFARAEWKPIRHCVSADPGLLFRSRQD